METVWDGITRSDMLSESAAQVRQHLANTAKSYNWTGVFAILDKHRELINTTRPGGSSLYAPIHQAAHGGAQTDVILYLIGLGAWRTLQNARGERPVDIAERRGHSHLLSILSPQLKRRVPLGVLLKIQSHFRSVIHERAENEVRKGDLRLPELEPLLEFDKHKVWFAVPGMYGGFSYWLETEGVWAKLVVESWSRVVGGSGQRHEITSSGSKLVAQGFV